MTSTTGEIWWRNRWMEAVWTSNLKPLEKLVAAVFADHARDQRLVWVTYGRLVERTGLSRDAANRALQGVRDAGWLVTVEKGRQHKPTVYALTIPAGSSTADGPLSSTGGVPLNASSSTSPDTSSTSPDTSSTGDVLNQSTYQSSHQSSSSRSHAAQLLGWAEDDDRMEHLEAFLVANDVKSAKAWLTRCHDNGDLQRNLIAFVNDRTTQQAVAKIWGEEDMPFGADHPDHRRGILLAEYRDLFGHHNFRAGQEMLRREAEYMEIDDPYDPQVVASAIITVKEQRKRTKEQFG